jgi:UDP-N-acetylmuramate--alanine ligase
MMGELERMHVHIIGIGGSGMSALATVLLDRGAVVSGSDLKDSSVLDRLRARGAAIAIGHDDRAVEGADVVAYSSAIGSRNVEVLGAQARGLTLWTRADLLVALTEGERVAAVAGTHGKTTTTSMLALALAASGLDPSFVVGGELNEAGSSARAGESGIFVVEADESDGTFLRLTPEVAVVTNVEPDHLDYFGDLEALKAAFRRFGMSARRSAVVCFDDDGAREVFQGLEVLSYGLSDEARFRIRNLSLAPHMTSFELFDGRERLGQVDLPIPGIHNVRNATAALIAGMEVGASLEQMALSLSRFVGVQRRFQYKRRLGDITVVDDYAHLPTEIRATLQAARQVSSGRVLVVFQPHRYSRTAQLATELGEALEGADCIVVANVYGAGEDPVPGISGALVADAARVRRGDAVTYVEHRAELAVAVRALLQPGDLVLSMGAGDVTLLDQELYEQLGRGQ